MPLVVAGCNLIWSDDYKPRSLWVSNEISNTVLVELSRWQWHVVVEPGQHGRVWTGEHPFPTEVELLTTECRAIDTVDITANEDTLIRVTTSGVEVVTDPSPEALNDDVIAEASPWPCN